ncbi:hypothetical protein [Aquabacterium sp.]|uniref:hypothetical protein n=1 Tax=Aquabacterium sp. TaxID=1872578 RepID=UPI003D6D37AB
MSRHWLVWTWIPLVGSALAAEGPAGLGRDPTQIPPSLQQAAGLGANEVNGPSGSNADTPAQPFFIMTHGGRLVVIHRAHRLKVGDEMDNARIVRIDNDAVWLREDGLVKRMSIYPDVLKRPAAKPTAAPSSPHSASSRQRHRRPATTKKDAP